MKNFIHEKPVGSLRLFTTRPTEKKFFVLNFRQIVKLIFSEKDLYKHF